MDYLLQVKYKQFFGQSYQKMIILKILKINKSILSSIKISYNQTFYEELKQIQDSIEQNDSKKIQKYYTNKSQKDQTELR
ncbi:unnamed protein product [Paramecium pentaurelia]|uniref:Uncharacterized protein n=1 Tax=Paramecium pentaurelia TaxID=43138 RepID=A0A8S1XJI6_9CILI|nr:unnamed protein product [Paramecium pentaurelia]